MSADLNRERLRQQMLLRALWRDPDVARGWLRGLSAGTDAGIAAYRGNAAAVAERALAAAFPTVAELIGAESFAALARDLWRREPPTRGDLAEWGGVLPAFIAAQPSLAGEPYLADCAALDWAVHRASRAADLHALPSTARRLPPGSAVVESAHPIVAIWLAHQRPADDAERFTEVRAAFAEQRAETALVWRDGFHVRVAALPAAELALTRALLAGAHPPEAPS